MTILVTTVGRDFLSFNGFISWDPMGVLPETGGPQQPALQPGSQLQRKMALEAREFRKMVRLLGWDVLFQSVKPFIWGCLKQLPTYFCVDLGGLR